MLRDLDAARRTDRRVGGAERVGVEAGAGADAAAARAAVAEVHGDAVVGVTGHGEQRRREPCGRLNFSSTTSLTIWPCSPPWNAGFCEAFSFAAVAGLAITALSQVSLVIGFGSSCSQPLLANRPSRIDGSGRNDNLEPAPAGGRSACCRFAAQP